MANRLQILQGDALMVLKTLPTESVQMCVTSPPYWGLRDYNVAGQLGLESTPEEYVGRMVEVFRELRRVLRGDGTLWLNIGDSYARDFAKGGSGPNGKHDFIPDYGNARKEMRRGSGRADGIVTDESPRNRDGTFVNGSAWPLKPKDLCGIPWRLAFALQADGWWLRQDIIWHKPNPMPESVTDRCTKAHEYIFLLTKSARYFFDAEAVKEPNSEGAIERFGKDNRISIANRKYEGQDGETLNAAATRMPEWLNSGRNKRSVWTVPSAPYSEAHFATFPPDLIKPCILAGTSARGCCPKCGAPWERIVEPSQGYAQLLGKGYHDHKGDGIEYGLRQKGKGPKNINGMETYKTTGWQPTCECGLTETVPCTVCDPFFGSGTTGQVALELGRHCIGIELNPQYVKLAQHRCNVTPGLALA